MRLTAVFLACCLSAAPALAQDMAVGPLRPGDTLNLRSGPAPHFPVISQLPPGAGPLVRDTCVLWINSRSEPDARRMPEWCLVKQGDQPLGWVAARYLIPAEGALRIVRGWRDESDACKLIGETALTGEFLDDSADLVGCPVGAEHRPLPGQVRPLGQMLGYELFSVTRNH